MFSHHSSLILVISNSFFAANASTDDKARLVSAAQLEQAEVLTLTLNNFNVLQKAIYENLQASILGEKTVDQAIADAEKQWNS